MAFDAQVTEKSADMIVLEKARAIVARGWCIHTIDDGEGNHCLAGAINLAHHGDAYYRYDRIAYFDRAMLALGFESGEIGDLCVWNNTHTQADALARLDTAIAKLAAAQ